MTLTELIAGVEAHRKTLTVFNATESEITALRDHFSDRNIDVQGEQTPAGPQRYVVLSKGDDFVTATSIDSVLGTDGTASQPASYRPILDHLDETTFTSYDMDQMGAASHEIEDRAWRIGSGTVYAGFGTVSALEFRIDAYERLADKKPLSVHLYAFPDSEIPTHDDVTVHLERSEEIRTTWFVAYDGDGADTNKCALLAEEREPDTFYGFWTYDPDTVNWIIDHVVTNYTITDHTSGSQ
ncbi:DICT sensory domain-containing protein [Halocatena pleomorpha]|uniref:Histidine kinase n=1 Tax=Halocatena pleomorpha TaxID=1785090 RepID=A0A3P3R6Z3_9EURY|nr:DICT sensory domain-containing protein [Halocatena pleomorpha]RRJ29125.1 histidine kinase [Halocatena pleomorpha]